jgi:hypothetical protein
VRETGGRGLFSISLSSPSRTHNEKHSPTPRVLSKHTACKKIITPRKKDTIHSV